MRCGYRDYIFVWSATSAHKSRAFQPWGRPGTVGAVTDSYGARSDMGSIVPFLTSKVEARTRQDRQDGRRGRVPHGYRGLQELAGVADDVDARPLEHHRRSPTLAVAPTSLDHMCHARSGECCSSGRSIAAAGQWAALMSSGRLRHRLRHRKPPPTRWPRGSTRYPRASRWLSASST